MYVCLYDSYTLVLRTVAVATVDIVNLEALRQTLAALLDYLQLTSCRHLTAYCRQPSVATKVSTTATEGSLGGLSSLLIAQYVKSGVWF
jgi:hypothetical protein